MTKKILKTCKNCKYFTGLTCRRHPPQIMMANGAKIPFGKGISPNYFSTFPSVGAHDWCGEFNMGRNK